LGTTTHTRAPTLLDLCDAAAASAELTGAKAAELARMLAAGLPVPDGFCVTTAAFRGFVAQASIEPPELGPGAGHAELARVAGATRERFRQASLPPELVRVIACAYRRLAEHGADATVAVRSSGTLEDRPGASFAGQHATILGVAGEDAVLEALRGCWASLYDAPALSYALARGIDLRSAAIAVLVQRLVDAEVSGVAFTRDPLTGEDAVVVDASWGLGEAVVSGWVTPDRYRLARNGELLQRHVAAKRVRAAPSVPGGRERVPDELVRAPCLDGAALAELARLVLRAEQVAGSPRDVEFALRDGKAWLLQSRPITAAGSGGASAGVPAAERSDLEPLLGPKLERWPADRWTRVIGDEYWADPVTPFTFGSMGVWIDRDTNKAIDRIMKLDLIDPRRPTLRLFHSHVYWNAETVAAGYRHLPRAARAGPLLAYLPAEMRAEAAAMPTAWAKALRGGLLARLRDRDSSARRNHRALAEHTRRVRRVCEALDHVELDRAGRGQVDRYWAAVDRLGQAHFEVIRWGMQRHSLTFNFALAKLLADWVGDDGQMFEALIGGAEQSLTLKTNREIWLLARLAERDAPVRAILERAHMPAVRAGPSPRSPLYEALTELAPEGPFAGALSDFLRRYGHRGPSREVALPRWSDQPDVVVGLVAQALGTEDPARRARRAAGRRAVAEIELRRRLGSGPRGRLRRAALALLLRAARIYTAFREDQRFTLDHVFLRARHAALAYGRLLAGDGLVADPSDAFFLTPLEIDKALGGQLADVRALAAARRAAFERDSDSLPPMYLRGDEALAEQPQERGERVLEGMPASAGRLTARCRVVRSLQDAGRLAPGEVMVASNVDPGWTPLFLRVGAVVLETGGVLAHGAIVAREYGIPAVTAVRAATRRISDGEWLTVDGRAGTVERHGRDTGP